MTTTNPTNSPRQSIEPTYDSRETGYRYHVTTQVGDRTISFQHRLADPFVRQTVHIGWKDLLRGLLRRHLQVTVIVGGDRQIVDDVMELDANTLVPNSTRRSGFDAGINTALANYAAGLADSPITP
jgi:hypothetical protein